MSAIGVASARNRPIACSPAWTSPAYATSAMTTGRPWYSAGTNGSGGAFTTLAIADSSSGAASASATKPSSTSGVAGSRNMPPRIRPTRCSRNFSRVTTPKLPPPPRIAQKRSG